MNTDSAAHNLSKFTEDSLWGTIFENKPPLFTTRPFFYMPGAHLFRNMQVTFGIQLSDLQGSALDILGKNLVSFGGKKNTDPSNVRELPLFIVEHLLKAYKDGVSEWYDFLEKNIESFCSSSRVKYKWRLLKLAGVGSVFSNSKLTYEQSTFINMCSILEQNDNLKLIEDIRESILPWLNPKMYTDIETKKKNTRENVAYERQKLKMLQGDLDQLDMVK